jgi:hypothetical protein
MSNSMPKTGSPAFYTVKQAAWILGVSEAELVRAIKRGVVPTVRRRSRLVVPAAALRRLLGGAT